jgi:hypothetical protein
MAAATAGGVAVGRALSGRVRAGWPNARPLDARRGEGWHVVTINRSLADVAPDGRLPDPVAQLGDGVEVRLRPAPGGKGTELAVRQRESEPDAVADLTARLTGDDPRQAVRIAVRRSKQLAETGEVLSPHRTPTGERTPLNRPVEAPARRPGGRAVP